jgi:FkbM family methyltransferase
LSFKVNGFSNYFGFDPICYPSSVINYLKKHNVKVFFSDLALSNYAGIKNFFITKRKDSSSLKKPKNIASEYFPKVYTIKSKEVKVTELNSFIELINDLNEPRLLKIDVQGNEYELLRGSELVLNMFNYIVIECTYFDLYEDIKFKVEYIDKFLLKKNFSLLEEYNKVFRKNKLISSDRLYIRN